MDARAVRDRASDLPTEPGVYQFLADEQVLYVGKAVDIRDRVRSYADPRSRRIERMVDRADAIDVAVTDTETQALLLEANMIKRHQPRYNVRLKDDKSYPLVQLTDHPVPRIEITRDPDEGATVYGPYTSRSRLETVVKGLREIYGVRGCSDHKYANRDRPCLDYEVGICTAPCTGEISEAAYAEDVTATQRFFEGEIGVLATPLRRSMEQAAESREFERAANLRDRLQTVEAFHGDSGAAVASEESGGERLLDVLGVAIEGEEATVARLHSDGGQLVDRDRHTLAAPDSGPDQIARVLSAFVPQYYAERELPDALVLPEHLDDQELAAWLDAEDVAVRVPGAGREATLVDLALKNARRGTDGRDEVGALAAALDIDRPTRIEGFDVSHAQGNEAVGSNVTFVDGSRESSDYRRKRLNGGNDDYANMRSLVEWRASRAVEGCDDRPDPDLLVIDGGEGQLSAARAALDAIDWDIPTIAIAKDEELVITPERTHDWPDDAPQLHLVQRVRDEAHRFALQYHQTLRDEVSTALDGIDGIGPETRKRLLGRFGSVKGVRGASRDELLSVEGVGEGTVTLLEEQL
ncbi:excinuclease ABC subunit C [Natranaeroarchaeum sulfidigenes]|uniref:UvrABC system protein C n=1 Tax=Natranaeroarchaeum sulfidigenes TaxID=2784880 RepID=A0A897MQ89_9EURY|nr:excinuclease ABC subunit C [Natranaeroarchaeum sulfidigenes]QSG04320.1 Excinuclease ABC subunit C [Natranaeroarchaeum sulfidigenes]